MVNFLKKKLNSLTSKKKSKVLRELPKSYAGRKVVVGKKKPKTVSKPNSFYIKIATWLLGLVFLGVTIYALFFSSFLRINMLEIAGAENLSQGEVRETMVLGMEGKAAGLFRRDNLLVANTQSMSDDLLRKYKIIKKIEIAKVFPNKLVVKVQERKSKLVYCTSGNCFVIDEEGRAYARADFEQGDLGENELLVLTDDGGRPVNPDDFFMDLSFIQFVSDVAEQLELADIRFKKNLSTPILVSGDLRVETEAGWKIFFNKQLGAKAGAEMLKVVLKNSITEEQLKDLEYIDVRLADKVYYKLRTNAQEDSSENVENPDAAPKAEEPKKSEKKKK